MLYCSGSSMKSSDMRSKFNDAHRTTIKTHKQTHSNTETRHIALPHATSRTCARHCFVHALNTKH